MKKMKAEKIKNPVLTPNDKVKEAIISLAKTVSWKKGCGGDVKTEHVLIASIEYLTETLLLAQNHELRIQAMAADLEALRRAIDNEPIEDAVKVAN